MGTSKSTVLICFQTHRLRMCSFPYFPAVHRGQTISRPHFSSSLTNNVLDSGKQLVIKANGTVKKAIEKGAYIDLTVKYGLIRLLTTTADLCEQMGEVDLKCPVEPGERVITKTVELPKEIPPVCHLLMDSQEQSLSDWFANMTLPGHLHRGR